MRILTGYLQAILIVKSFDLNWPTMLQGFLNKSSIFLSPELFKISMDCIFLAFLELIGGSGAAPISD